METTKKMAIYRKYSKADAYIIGFKYDNFLYIYNTKRLLTKWTKKAYTSRTHKPKIQMNLTQSLKAEMIIDGAKSIMPFDEFMNINASNNGWRLEKLVHKLNNIEYKGQNNKPFYKGGDITINGFEIQIKFENAQIATYATLRKLTKA